MACDEKLTERLREVLERPRRAPRNRMFGGFLAGRDGRTVGLIGMAKS